MKINNKKSIRKSIIWIATLFVTDVLFLIGLIMFDVKIKLLLLISLIIFLLLAWVFVKLRNFGIEITEQIIIVKYGHPVFARYNVPVLEFPVVEINNCKIDKVMMLCFLKVEIFKRNRYRIFCYRLDMVSKEQLILLERILSNTFTRDSEKIENIYNGARL